MREIVREERVRGREREREREIVRERRGWGRWMEGGLMLLLG